MAKKVSIIEMMDNIDKTDGTYAQNGVMKAVKVK